MLSAHVCVLVQDKSTALTARHGLRLDNSRLIRPWMGRIRRLLVQILSCARISVATKLGQNGRVHALSLCFCCFRGAHSACRCDSLLLAVRTVTVLLKRDCASHAFVCSERRAVCSDCESAVLVREMRAHKAEECPSSQKYTREATLSSLWHPLTVCPSCSALTCRTGRLSALR